MSPFEARMERIEALVAEIEALPLGAPRESARELVAALLELHGAALARILAIAAENGEAGGALVETMTRDPLVGSVLVLHDVHPRDLATRVQSAITAVSTTFRGAAKIVLLGVDEGAIRIRVDDPPSGAAVRLRVALEEAILAAAPDRTSLDIAIEGDTVLLPASRLHRRNAESPPRDAP